MPSSVTTQSPIVSPDHVRLFEAITRRLDELADRATPMVLGLCGAQGSGKSTWAAAAADHFTSRGTRTAILSIDDLYLPRTGRRELADRIHPLLATRGVPGTHDVALGLSILADLDRGDEARFPRFDKATDDRRPDAFSEMVPGNVDLVIFEGWCVGARPEAADALHEPVNALEREEDPDGRWRRHVNEALGDAYQALFARLDMLILLAAPDFDIVAQWRTEQEHDLRHRQGEDGVSTAVMSDAEVSRFVAHYERLTRHILREMPARADVVAHLREDRSIIRLDPAGL
jgi:D-glycerate 3-kinase